MCSIGLNDRLNDRLSKPQGGYPERCGICVAALDTVSQGIQGHFRPGAASGQRCHPSMRRFLGLFSIMFYQ